MRTILLLVFTGIAIQLNANICDIQGRYRCNNGLTGTVFGSGKTLQGAKNAAREQARDICGGMVDYVRFLDFTANC